MIASPTILSGTFSATATIPSWPGAGHIGALSSDYNESPPQGAFLFYLGCGIIMLYMILSDRDLLSARKDGLIRFDPDIEDDQVGPASIDLRLGYSFLLFKSGRNLALDPRVGLPDGYMESLTIKDDQPFILHPQQFAIGATLESVTVPHTLRVKVEGKSTLARMGLLVHTAGFVDPGFFGNLTLEFSNHGPLPIMMYPGMRICQVEFAQMATPAQVPYDKRTSSLYCGDDGPAGARMDNLLKRS